MTIPERLETALQNLQDLTLNTNRVAAEHLATLEDLETARVELALEEAQHITQGLPGKNERERDAHLLTLTATRRQLVTDLDTEQRRRRLQLEVNERNLTFARTRVKVLHALLLTEVSA
jgi:hypothetical protein